MNKWIAVPIISILIAGLIATGFLYLQKPNKLEDTQSEIVTLEGDISALETELAEAEAEVSALEGDILALETELINSKAGVLALEADLADAEARVSVLEARISPEVSVFLSEIDGLTVTVDGEVILGIGGSIIARVHWDWGDGNSEDHFFPASHIYEAQGEYTITVTAYQNDGLTNTKTFIFYTPTDTPLAMSIPDLALEVAIREAIDKLGGTLYTSDLESLITLEAPAKGILDLTGLEYCVNLQYLGLWDNNISDISVLAGLTNLEQLELGENSVSDISPLVGLTNLQWLNLWENSISDISVLAGLINLEGLSLGVNNISDISALADSTNLEILYLYDNNISDISPLASLANLEWLDLSYNTISDISPRAGLLNLEGFSLGDNNISDISALVDNAGLSDGDSVALWLNPLSTTSVDVYIPQLEARGVLVTA
jgi:hypothetical protein